MRKTTGSGGIRDNIGAVCVTMPNLMIMLDCGRPTAERIADAAGAKFKVGKRALYNVDKVRKYINTLNASGQEQARCTGSNQTEKEV